MNLPNLLTLIRIALVPVFFAIIIQSPAENPQAPFFALLIFCVAAATDALDGFLARVLKQQTELGMFLDPLADKLLIVSGFLGILITGQPVFKPSMWIQVTVLFREIVIVLGFLTLHFFSKNILFRPNWIGKMTTFSQMLLILFCILNWPGAFLFSLVVAFFTVTSGIVYTVRELKQFS